MYRWPKRCAASQSEPTATSTWRGRSRTGWVSVCMRKLRLQNNRSVESLNLNLVANDFSQDRNLNSRLLRHISRAPDSRAFVAYLWERAFVDIENDSSQSQTFTSIGHLELRWLILDIAPKWAHRRAQPSKKAAAQGWPPYCSSLGVGKSGTKYSSDAGSAKL